MRSSAREPAGGDRPVRLPPSVLAGWPAVTTLTVASAAIVIGYFAGGSPVRQAMLMTSSTIAAVAVAAGVRVNRLTDRRPWTLAAAGLTGLTVVNAWWYLHDVLPGVQPNWITDLVQIVSYVFMLSASLLIVVRHAPHDGGGVIDAAVIGLAVAAPLWEFLLRPRLLHAGIGLSGQMVTLVEVLVLLGILGSLQRVSRTTVRGRPSLRLLFASLVFTVGGIVLFDAGGVANGSKVSVLCYIGGYLCLGGAALHPSAEWLLRPVATEHRETTRLRFGLLGGSMVLIPVVGGIPQLFGEPADGLLLTLAPLIMVPLVLTRIGQLLRQRTRDQRHLAYQATHDELTGLVNRRHVFITVARSASARPVAVLYCDLDDFKPINDRYGHHAGDEVLRCVARRLVESLREQDVVARIGGDEFLAYCPGADPETADVLRRRVEESLRAPIRWEGVDLQVAVTVGTAYDDGRYAGPDELIAAADQAMYERKRARKAARAGSGLSAAHR